MARNRASMREGPLAELFRATEAAQRQGTPGKNDQSEQQALPVEPPVSPPTRAAEPPRAREERVRAEAPRAPEPTPIRSLAPAPDLEPEPARGDPPKAARWLDPLPDQPARLERARDNASYLAVIRVVGEIGRASCRERVYSSV